jgi:hypothetical protein
LAWSLCSNALINVYSDVWSLFSDTLMFTVMFDLVTLVEKIVFLAMHHDTENFKHQSNEQSIINIAHPVCSITMKNIDHN